MLLSVVVFVPVGVTSVDVNRDLVCQDAIIEQDLFSGLGLPLLFCISLEQQTYITL